MARTDGAASHDALSRRLVSIPTVLLVGVGLALLLPLWVPCAVLADAVRLRWRFPLARLLAFALCWAWLEAAGVTAAAGLWLIGRGGDVRRHARLQRWWAAQLMGALRATTGVDLDVHGVDAFTPGPTVVLSRHASLADSLVSAHVITALAGLTPRYVLKRELLVDPCLDIVGNRMPNHFIDRGADDTGPELAALTALAQGMGPHECAVIFPEGTRANASKRARALEKIRDRDPERADRLAGLTTLLPPRPAGAQALLQGAPEADCVLCWHTGFDGLDTFGGILRHLAGPHRSVRFVARRVPRASMPAADDTPAFTRWLDDRWCELDAEATAAIRPTTQELAA